MPYTPTLLEDCPIIDAHLRWSVSVAHAGEPAGATGSGGVSVVHAGDSAGAATGSGGVSVAHAGGGVSVAHAGDSVGSAGSGDVSVAHADGLHGYAVPSEDDHGQSADVAHLPSII